MSCSAFSRHRHAAPAQYDLGSTLYPKVGCCCSGGEGAAGGDAAGGDGGGDDAAGANGGADDAAGDRGDKYTGGSGLADSVAVT